MAITPALHGLDGFAGGTGDEIYLSHPAVGSRRDHAIGIDVLHRCTVGVALGGLRCWQFYRIATPGRECREVCRRVDAAAVIGCAQIALNLVLVVRLVSHG